jgi:hypothetical protein
MQADDNAGSQKNPCVLAADIAAGDGFSRPYVAAHPQHWSRPQSQPILALNFTDLGFELCKLHVLMISNSAK